MQGASLLGDNIKFSKKKNKDTTDFARQSVKNIVGIEFIGMTADALA
jgi:hypothetical protein